MSRTTQYIGLNNWALKLVKDSIKQETYKMTTGMFDEPVYGSVYHMVPPKGPNKALKYIEVVQDTPWSSGPMVFTALKQVLVKESGQVIEDNVLYCPWILDPSLSEEHTEYDQETGRYYV
jgi:hypothetical protein